MMVRPAHLEASHILGAWALERWEIARDGKIILPFGPQAKGRIQYCVDGFMNAVIERPERPLPMGDDAADILKSYMHYSGRWHIDGFDVVHDVDHALDPRLIGHSLRRHVTLNGDRMILRGEDTSRTPPVQHTLYWRRSG
jgi:hypothetical protein